MLRRSANDEGTRGGAIPDTEVTGGGDVLIIIASLGPLLLPLAVIAGERRLLLVAALTEPGEEALIGEALIGEPTELVLLVLVCPITGGVETGLFCCEVCLARGGRAALFASVSRKDTNNSEKLSPMGGACCLLLAKIVGSHLPLCCLVSSISLSSSSVYPSIAEMTFNTSCLLSSETVTY